MIPGEEWLDDLERTLARMLAALESGEPVEVRRVRGSDDGLKVTTNVRIQMGLPGSALPVSRPFPHQPLVDLLEDKDSIRVLVSLPGVRKEDVDASFSDGALFLRVRRGEQTHAVSVPCPVRPADVSLRSVVENNSVIELTFAKRTHGRRTRRAQKA